MKTLVRSFIPHPLNTRPAEWCRAALGACFGIFLTGLLSRELFGIDVTLHLLGPIGASAVLLFAVSAGPLAQPWSIIGSYLISALVALLCIHLLGNTISAASVAVCSAIVIMCVCRCLHPPGAAVAISIITSQNTISGAGLHVLLPVMLNASALLITALIYNNLTQVRYPKPHARSETGFPSISKPEPGGFQAQDLAKALEDVGTFVDMSHEDLETILHKTEENARHRNRSDIDTTRIIARNMQSLTLEHSVADAMKILARQGGQYLPVLDADHKVIGVISLVD
ncbi:HPP family protein [Pseudomonas sp. LP_7_YM]|uniref:HPP family protein n=1 Tax=Pseudomonas sp. LP_7_YM TaxID=2485137 RepID=UPI00105FAE25|nr:HPP family protein [Pseudomonas sp. LP_7_YM]TDV65750.1 CBS domain-containing membrane protein [Pseudomonas sp. LP_7_YM]